MEQKNISKLEWFKNRLRGNFFIFDNNSFPKLTDTSYDPLLFEVVNGAYIMKDKLDDFFKILEPLIVFDETKNDYKIDSPDTSKIKNALIEQKILSGLSIFELSPKGTAHLDFLEELGAIIPEQVKNNSIPISGVDAIKLKSWDEYVKEKYDITFSSGLMDDNSGIKYNNHSAIFSGFELYSIYSNITKKNGFSFHANGSLISSLYETYFQFIGFKVIEYFRNSDGPINFTMIMEKINNKQTSYDEFFYIYTELKKRWPARYGN